MGFALDPEDKKMHKTNVSNLRNPRIINEKQIGIWY